MDTFDKKSRDLLHYSLNPIPFMSEILSLEMKEFHREWINLFENNKFVSLLAPRGHGKTSITGAYIIWRILRDPDIRILIVTINQDKADEMMTFIQHHLEKNTHLTELFGEQKGYSRDWSRSTLRVMRAGRSGFAHKEPTLQVLGITSSMVGSHFDLIVLDDITDQKNSRTPTRREDLRNWYNMTLLPMLEPDGQIISIGTKWHEADIHDTLSKSPMYIHKRYQAVIDIEKKLVIWPERFSFEKLQEIKSDQGSLAFELQYQNNVISDETSPIKMDWVEASLENYKTPSDVKETYMGVDFASKGEESDYFCITVVALKEGLFYVVDGLRTNKASLFQQFELITSYFHKWKPIRIGIESSAQQKLITDQLQESTTLPIIPIKSSSINDKLSRVQRLSVLFETGRIFLNPVLSHWRDELIIFPRGRHEDTIDALSFAIQSSQSEDEKKIDWSNVASMLSKKPQDREANVKKSYNIIKL